MRLHRRYLLYIDFHGVIVDVQELKAKIVWIKFRKRISAALLKRDTVLSEGLLTPAQYDEVVRLIHEEEWLLQAKPIPGASKYIRKLLKAGCEVVIVTASSEFAFSTVMKWLEKQRFPLHTPGFRVVGTGWNSNKTVTMGLADFILEDEFGHLQNAHTFAQARLQDATWTAAHRKAHLVLLDRPYNRDVDVGEIAVRMPSWKDFYEYVRSLAWTRRRSKRVTRRRPHRAP